MDRRTVLQKILPVTRDENKVGGLILPELSAPMPNDWCVQKCSPYQAGPVAASAEMGLTHGRTQGLA
jgi:hypothetical protein